MTTRLKYTTRNEHDIGSIIVDELASNVLRPLNMEETVGSAGSVEWMLTTIQPDLLLADRHPTQAHKPEDSHVNSPMQRVAQKCLPSPFAAVLTVARSRLVDGRARAARRYPCAQWH